MMKTKKSDTPIVLVGTYRPENADWIAAKRLYNLPLPKCGKLAFHGRIGGIVLFAEGACPLAFKARFKEVVDRSALAATGYSLAEPAKAHGETYAPGGIIGNDLFSVGDRLRGGLRARLPTSSSTQAVCFLTQRTRRETQRAQVPLRPLRQSLCGLRVENAGCEMVCLRFLQTRGVAA